MANNALSQKLDPPKLVFFSLLLGIATSVFFGEMAKEGAAWTLLHPAFTVVVPQPAVRIPVAYTVA